MKEIANSYHPKNNFWDMFPDFIACDPFAKLYKADKTPKKVESSAKMWAIALAYHPKSNFYYLPDKEGKIASAMKSQQGVSINWKSLDVYVRDFIEMTLDQAHKSLIAWERRMKERDEFLDAQKWAFDYISEEGKLIKGNADQLDKMHSQTHKHYKEYEMIVKELKDLELKDRSSKNNVEELDV